MIAAVRCPRCGAAVELPIGLGTRLVHTDDGASFITATTRAGKVDHVCATTRLDEAAAASLHSACAGFWHVPRGWVVVDE